ncbi:MAG TPA: hypothetical protein VLK65_31185 [Vicinamibacteria bacterium]|nr:hypothetical protein [Vicinamibacteria bacterium]
MMARTQITLDLETRRRARERAADLGISFAEYIRTLVERDLARPSQNTGPSVVFDLGSSNGSDVARNKDSMLGTAVESERLRRTSK